MKERKYGRLCEQALHVKRSEAGSLLAMSSRLHTVCILTGALDVEVPEPHRVSMCLHMQQSNNLLDLRRTSKNQPILRTGSVLTLQNHIGAHCYIGNDRHRVQ